MGRQKPELFDGNAHARWQELFGEDEEKMAREEHRLLINGVPYSLLYKYCLKHNLETKNSPFEMYAKVAAHLKEKR